VHEHGKYLVQQALLGLGAYVVDAGASADPESLVARAAECGADAIAISTYNGIALRYAKAAKAAMEARGLSVPVLIGGRLNQIPEDSNSGLPVDVAADIADLGITPCAGLDEMLSALQEISASPVGLAGRAPVNRASTA
jgi:methylmalonyl-CoA mutase cobalamin-binding subunit